jgi:DNA modification methylase
MTSNCVSDPVTIGPCTLYCGNSLDLLPTIAGNIGAVVTDPPYGIAGGKGSNVKRGKGRYEAAFTDDPAYVAAVCVPVIEQCLRLGVPMGVTTGIPCLHLYPSPTDIGCFWTPAAVGRGPWGFSTFNPILYYGKDARAGRGQLPSGTQVTERPEPNGHPCPKPLKAWTWLVDKVAPPGVTVLDPFMGSGTTAIACLRTGRGFVGIELSPVYFQIACERVAGEWARLGNN